MTRMLQPISTNTALRGIRLFFIQQMQEQLTNNNENF